MSVIDSFKTNSTNVEFAWPADVIGLERIMLSAHGDLQRLLSSFFARPIEINRIHAHTSPRTQAASPEQPITQRREVHLLCSRKTVCVATSAVKITSPLCERLFLDEKFAIGQLFRKMATAPDFALLECGAGVENGKRKLWRRYILATEGIECDITEVFPDREMFVRGEAWLEEGDAAVSETPVSAEESKMRYASSAVPVIA